jgi:pimeloyl-ACP methyl ester carboxylesterase
MSLNLAYRFLLSRFIPLGLDVRRFRRNITGRFGSHPSFVYEPLKPNGAVLLVFPGLSVYGYQDPRINHLARSFASLGFTSVVPMIPEFEELRIDPNTINRFSDLILRIHEDTAFNRSAKPLGLFAPSYAGGVALLAATKCNVSHCVSSIMLLGSFYNFRSMITELMHTKSEDPYAMMVLVRNLLPYTPWYSEDLDQILLTAILDNGFKRRVPESYLKLSKTSASVRALFHNITADLNFRTQMFSLALEKIEEKENWRDRFDISRKIAQLEASISLIHGREDAVIPASESEQLFQLLKNNNKPASLLITDLLDHGDTNWSLSSLKEVHGLCQMFAGFFQSVREAVPKHEALICDKARA